MSALDFTARALALRAAQDVRSGGSVILNGATGDGVTDDEPALNAFIAGGGHVHFPAADYKIGGTLFVPSDTRIDFAKGARLLPITAQETMIIVAGAPPTAWVALTSDLAAGAKTWTHTSDAYAVGQWVEFRSNALDTSGPNTAIFSKIACVRKIVKKTGVGPYVYSLNKPVLDSFNVADAAEVGLPTMVENVVLENVTINDENFAVLIGFGIYLRYCAHITIINPTIYGSKQKTAADLAAIDGIKINFGCFDVTVENPQMKHIGWYGITLAGEQIRVSGGCMEDMRHAVSVVFTPYGTPTDIIVDGMTANNTTLSGFDTHDTGRDVVFSNCIAHGSGDDGFQTRTNGVRFIGCTANNSAIDGFSDHTGAGGTVLIGCKSNGNGRIGYNFTGPAQLIGCEGHNHNGPQSGAAGVQLQSGGLMHGGRFTNNNNVFRIYDAPLLVESVCAPYSATQSVFASAISGLGGRYNRVTFRNNEIPDYPVNSVFARQISARPAGDLPPTTSGNRLTTDAAGAEQRGEVTLVAGTATVATSAVKRQTGANWTEDVISKVELRRVSPGGGVGNLYVESVTNGVSFVIRSTSATDTSKVGWTVEL
jgi:hypothetical protein